VIRVLIGEPKPENSKHRLDGRMEQDERHHFLQILPILSAVVSLFRGD
jgi:hypothetical protein